MCKLLQFNFVANIIGIRFKKKEVISILDICKILKNLKKIFKKIAESSKFAQLY